MEGTGEGKVWKWISWWRKTNRRKLNVPKARVDVIVVIVKKEGFCEMRWKLLQVQKKGSCGSGSDVVEKVK